MKININTKCQNTLMVHLAHRPISTKPQDHIFQAPFNKMFALNDQGSKDIEEYEQQFKVVAQILYKASEQKQSDMSSTDISQVVQAIGEILRNCRIQRSLFSNVLLLLNDLVDMYPQHVSDPKTGVEARSAFLSLLEYLEKNIKININNVSQQTLADTIYYFCKFRAGSDEFWTILESQLLKNAE